MKRRRFQFSLRTLLLVVTVVCVWLGVETERARRQKRAIDAILAAGGRVHYDFQIADDDSLLPAAKPWAPRWLESALGREYLCRVECVTLYPTKDHPADKQVRLLTGIPYLKKLAIWPGCKGKTRIVGHPGFPGGLTDDGVSFLLKNLRSLKHLSLTAARISNQGVENLLGSPTINSLQVNRHEAFGGDSPVTTYHDMDDRPHIVTHPMESP